MVQVIFEAKPGRQLTMTMAMSMPMAVMRSGRGNLRGNDTGTITVPLGVVVTAVKYTVVGMLSGAGTDLDRAERAAAPVANTAGVAKTAVERVVVNRIAGLGMILRMADGTGAVLVRRIAVMASVRKSRNTQKRQRQDRNGTQGKELLYAHNLSSFLMLRLNKSCLLNILTWVSGLYKYGARFFCIPGV